MDLAVPLCEGKSLTRKNFPVAFSYWIRIERHPPFHQDWEGE